MDKNDLTLCWDCRHSVTKGCEWASDGKPVDGWVAEQTYKRGYGSTWCVKKCPKFVRDSYHGGEYRTLAEYKKYLKGVAKRTREKERKENE